jgi:hypothetical protein
MRGKSLSEFSPKPKEKQPRGKHTEKKSNKNIFYRLTKRLKTSLDIASDPVFNYVLQTAFLSDYSTSFETCRHQNRVLSLAIASEIN